MHNIRRTAGGVVHEFGFVGFQGDICGNQTDIPKEQYYQILDYNAFPAPTTCTPHFNFLAFVVPDRISKYVVHQTAKDQNNLLLPFL